MHDCPTCRGDGEIHVSINSPKDLLTLLQDIIANCSEQLDGRGEFIFILGWPDINGKRQGTTIVNTKNQDAVVTLLANAMVKDERIAYIVSNTMKLITAFLESKTKTHIHGKDEVNPSPKAT